MNLPPNPNVKIDFSSIALTKIVLAGGCFWGTQAFMARVPGVAATRCGYANGERPDPTYEQVCQGNTGHAEAVEVTYAPDMISLRQLLMEFFKTINPTAQGRQGNDVGSQYRTGIYYMREEDEPVARGVLGQLQEDYSRPIMTEVLPLSCFYEAEAYHQDYLERNPEGYCHVDLSLLRQ